MHEALRTIKGYEVLRELGRGGMAVVYLARQEGLDRRVALKELAGLHAHDPDWAKRFLREAHLAGSLSHPNIVTVHEYFEHDGVPYLAMEFLEPGSLRQYMGGLNLAQIAGVLEGVLAGLSHAEATASSTATSSPRTSWSRRRGESRSPTSALRRRSTAPGAT